MPGFLKSRRNQLLIGGFIIILLLLGGAFLFLNRPKAQTASTTTSSADVSPSPSADISPSPLPLPSPSPSPVPPANPAISAANPVLRVGPASDDAASTTFGGNGSGTCHADAMNWHHTGWTQDNCDIFFGSGQDQSYAWVTESKADGSKRVSIMTNSDGAGYWKTKLYRIGGPGEFTALTVKTGDLTGDGVPEVLVGFRSPGTQPLLSLDGVQRTTGHDPKVVVHRELTRGRAVVSGGTLTDYSANPDTTYVKTVITYSGGAFHGTTSSVPTAPAGDFP